MYDKLFVLDLNLSEWLLSGDRIKGRFADLESKDLLNHRLVERGARMVAVAGGRVVFQLPRGNF
jgi:hypothetical protein